MHDYVLLGKMIKFGRRHVSNKIGIVQSKYNTGSCSLVEVLVDGEKIYVMPSNIKQIVNAEHMKINKMKIKLTLEVVNDNGNVINERGVESHLNRNGRLETSAILGEAGPEIPTLNELKDLSTTLIGMFYRDS